MYIEGKVKDRCTLRKFANIAIWSEDKYLSRGRLCIKSLGNILLCLIHQLSQTLQPLLRGLCSLIDTLVAPVCGNTELGNVVHTLCTNLNLYPLALAGRDRCVQTLVTIRLRDGNPVAHTVGIWCVEVAHYRVDYPTLRLLLLLRTVDNNTQGKDVVDTLKWHLLLAHLVPN